MISIKTGLFAAATAAVMSAAPIGPLLGRGPYGLLHSRSSSFRGQIAVDTKPMKGAAVWNSPRIA